QNIKMARHACHTCSFCRCRMENKRGRMRCVKHWQTTLAILAALAAPCAPADDFKTIDEKQYKNVDVSRVEPDGIIVITFSGGIVKILFNELSPKIKKKYGYNPQAAAAFSAEQSEQQAALAQQRKSDGEPPVAVEGSPVSSSQINLHWTDNANNKDRFELQRADGGSGATPQCGTFVTVQPSLPPSTIGFNDTGLPASHWYCYRVRAFSVGGNSSWSNSVSVRTH